MKTHRDTAECSPTISRDAELLGVASRKPEDATRVAEHLTSAFRQPVVLGGRELDVTLSIGISLFPVDGVAPDETAAARRSCHVYALDRDKVATRYQLWYLDTKYALDRAGVIRFADYYPADYNTWVRALATVGIRR